MMNNEQIMEICYFLREDGAREKGQEVTKNISKHPLGTKNINGEFHGHPVICFRYIQI